MKKPNRALVPYGALLLLAALIYGALALSDSIWADEAYTFAMLRHGFGEIWAITAADVHPPLYYFAAKLFAMPFGYAPFAVRLFSALCYFLILAIGGWQLTRLFSRKIGLYFMALFLLFPFGLEHAAETRMYALAALGVFLCALFAYRAWLWNRAWDWAGFVAAGLCAGYSHYFSLVAAGAIYGLLLLCCLVKNRKLMKPWLIAAAATIVLYLPWLKCFLEQLAYKVSNEYWITPITLRSLLDDLLYLLHANGTGIFPLVFGLIGLGLAMYLGKKRAILPLLALAVPVLTLGVGLGVSAVMRPIFIIRYLAPCGPLMMFFLAYGIASIRREALVGGAVALLLTAFGGNLIFTFQDLLPDPARFGPAALAQAEQAQAYVIQVDNHLHLSQVTSYYEQQAPIYTPQTLGAASPYPNIVPLEEFSAGDYGCFAVLTNPDAQPEWAGFQARKLGSYYNDYNRFDLWLMERAEP